MKELMKKYTKEGGDFLTNPEDAIVVTRAEVEDELIQAKENLGRAEEAREIALVELDRTIEVWTSHVNELIELLAD